ncbi:Y+L amino acid transporter 1 [Amphibalanus amphitrite]|uniref:Y+L amino acid transporter 1 n=1 Tax=Amphibalanus amphitrite TaxID=1232801 RepID=A0A6A4VSD8_AMPAM|nr:Y+L amino acid transporter 1 [Amphibalanus amphitrite]
MTGLDTFGRTVDRPAAPVGAMEQEMDRRPSDSSGGSHVKLRKELGLVEGVAVILGIIIGSGIFISPVGVLQECGSVGMSLVVWTLCGVLSMIGALCYAELGTTIPKSGGDYAYILEAFGPLPAFLFLWDANLIFVPTTNAIMGLTFGNYVLQPFFPNCDVNSASVRLLAAAAICILTFVNCYNVKVTARLQNVFMVTKVSALLLVIIVGLVVLCMGKGQSFDNAFVGMKTDPGQIAVSFYSGIFSYAGWNYLNFMTEELRDPYRNLPRSIYLSLPLVTCIYVLANVSYLMVLSPAEMLASDAIAVTFANKTLGVMAWIMPLFVAFSAFGGLSVHIMTSSRLCFVGARNGHFPGSLALIGQSYVTPMPALVFLGLLSLVYLCTSDIFALINYASFIESSFILCSICGLLYLRWKDPHRERPIKVNILVPVVFLLICGFLVFMPLYVKPVEVGMGILITFTGVPAYMVFVYWKKKPAWALRAIARFNVFTQKLFLAVKEE